MPTRNEIDLDIQIEIKIIKKNRNPITVFKPQCNRSKTAKTRTQIFTIYIQYGNLFEKWELGRDRVTFRGETPDPADTKTRAPRLRGSGTFTLTLRNKLNTTLTMFVPRLFYTSTKIHLGRSNRRATHRETDPRHRGREYNYIQILTL